MRALVVSFLFGHAKASFRERWTRHAFLFDFSSLKSAAPTRGRVALVVTVTGADSSRAAKEADCGEERKQGPR